MKLKDYNLTKDELIEMAETYMNETFKRYDFIADENHDELIYDEK
jgi:acetylornithine/N-succinyldiaminopimelate aminotransferase